MSPEPVPPDPSRPRGVRLEREVDLLHNDRLAQVLTEFARTLVTDFPIQGILDHLVKRIVDVLPIDAAGVTLISPTTAPHFVAASDDSALQFVTLQTELGEGPCIEAYQTMAPVCIPDLDSGDHFLAFAGPARASGLAAVFTFPLRNDTRCLGALDLYRMSSGGLTSSEMETAQTLADVTTSYLLNAQSRADLKAAAASEHEIVEKLRDLDQARTEFVATASHELRTPITSIAGYAELLEDGAAGNLAGDQIKFLEAIHRNSDRLLTLVDDLLALSILDTHTVVARHAAVDLRDVVAASRDAVTFAAAKRGLDLQLELPRTALTVEGDALGLQRTVTNLLTNAVKFTEEGGWVRCVLRRHGGQAVLQVSDNGIGIPLAEQSVLFKRFFRASTAWEHAIQGSGLGLSLAKGIVETHGGTISVSSRERSGTTFVVRLPLAKSAAVPDQRRAIQRA